MALFPPDDTDAKRIDAALSSWRQGDVALDFTTFGHVADGTVPLTPEAADASEGMSFIMTAAEGIVVLTQTCDIVRNCIQRPFIEVAPLVEMEEQSARQVERGYFPSYAHVPALRSQRLVADLDRVMTVEKSIVATWTRTPGFTTDNEARTFARSLARKHARFAFPDDFNLWVKKLQSRIKEKHDKQSDEGRALRALREIRVNGSPNWDAAEVEVFFWFVRHDDEIMFEGKSWDEMLTAWKAHVPVSGRFSVVEGLVATLKDMTAEEYVESDPLDLDHLSNRGE